MSIVTIRFANCSTLFFLEPIIPLNACTRNLQKQKQVHILPGHNHWVRAITIQSGYLFTGGHNVIKMFDMANFNLARTMQQNCGSIYSIVVSGNMLYAATYENSILIWDLRTHEYVRSLAGHSGAVYSLCLDSENGKKLFSGSYDTTIRVHLPSTGPFSKTYDSLLFATPRAPPAPSLPPISLVWVV